MMEFLFPAIGDVDLTATGTIISMLLSLVLSVLISVVYVATNKKRGYISSFPAAIVILAPLMAGVTLIINSNVATAVSLGGALTLLRIRSYPKDTKDIVSLLFAIVVGLGCGTGYFGISIIITLVICALMIILNTTKFGVPKPSNMLLKITIPEDLNFEGIFDEVLEKYTEDYALKEIRTTDFGSLYELRYIINLPVEADRREFVDEIRCRNGNLDVILTLREFDTNLYK